MNFKYAYAFGALLSIGVVGCVAADDGSVDADTTDVGSLSDALSAVRIEAEARSWSISSGDRIETNSGNVKLRASQSGDFFKFSTPVEAGTYKIVLRYAKRNVYGKYDVKVAGSTVGSVDAYSSSTGDSWTTATLGEKALSGDVEFSFQVTGKSASASGYDLKVDYIELVPVEGAGSGGGDSGGGGTASAGGGGPGDGGAPGEGGGGGAGGATDTCGRAAACGSHKWACWPMPNPAGIGLPNPASYTDLGGGVVHDNVTCLDWQQSPPADVYTWDQAIGYCDSLTLGGFSDWRLPTRIEMTSLVDFTRSPAIDRTAFPGARGGFHKTSSDWILTIRQAGAGRDRDFAWAFNLSDGIVSNAHSKASAASLRCVRGNGAGEAPSSPAAAPPDQYTVVSPGEVRDNYTGLIWQQGYSPTTMTWEAAKSYCATLDLNDHAWRLPSIRELATLVDEALVAPSIHRTMFPDTQYGARSNDWYWGSHAAARNASAAWALNFDDGFTGFNAGASGKWNHFTAAWARCVR
ncbi:Lcl domain-containing protein [Sorangium sp. So ce1078]|uniref:Lcl domain-containing protein n=1 Tax=Sorangium sp. So ce1078 TaxID=3133329 RepID=UPI003F5EDD6F